jgi:hypothetical protein
MIILTVSREDQRVGPVLLFKGMSRVSPNEEKQEAQGVKVYFTPKSVNNKQTMDKYNQWFISQVRLVLSVVGNCLQYLFRFKTEILNCSSWIR